MQSTCSFPGCENPSRSVMLCDGHYQQMKRGQHLKPLRSVLKGKSPKERFHAKFRQGSHDECWIWQAAVNEHGYGVMTVGTRKDSRRVRAHRFSVEIQMGRPLSSDEVVLHVCDNPPCVNPLHLRVGTQQDNVMDAIQKRRMNTSASKATKLSTEAVKNIKSAIQAGVPQKTLAAEYGISKSLVSMINKGKRWSE